MQLLPKAEEDYTGTGQATHVTRPSEVLPHGLELTSSPLVWTVCHSRPHVLLRYSENPGVVTYLATLATLQCVF